MFDPYFNIVGAMFRDLLLDLRGEGYVELTAAQKQNRAESVTMIRGQLAKEAEDYLTSPDFITWATALDMEPDTLRERFRADS